MSSVPGRIFHGVFSEKVEGIVKLGVKNRTLPEGGENYLVKSHKFSVGMNWARREILNPSDRNITRGGFVDAGKGRDLRCEYRKAEGAESDGNGRIVAPGQKR